MVYTKMASEIQVNEISSTTFVKYGHNEKKYISWVDQLIDESGDGITPEDLAAKLDTKYDEFTVDNYLLQLQEEGKIWYDARENLFKYDRDECPIWLRHIDMSNFPIKLINPDQYWQWRYPHPEDEDPEVEVAAEQQ